MASRQTVINVLSILGAAYPGSTIVPDTISVYAGMLGDVHDDLLVAATKLCISRCRFFPTVAEIFEAVESLRDHASQQSSAMEAWGIVRREINRCGDYWRYDIGANKPNFENAIIAKVVNSMSYRALVESDNEEADRAHFMRAYDVEIKRRQAAQQIELIPEAHQIKNLIEGMAQKLSAPNKRERDGRQS